MSEEKILAAIKVECDRQKVGERQRKYLYNTYMVHRDFHDMALHHSRLCELAFQIEPENLGRYRTTPVSFNGIVGGVGPLNLPYVMRSWIEWFNDEKEDPAPDVHEANVEGIIREFLDIHPFSDGNGRTAWLLRVWMLNQWDDPQPLPNYYGE